MCSLLREVIDNHPPPQQTLLKKFLEEILASIDDMELDKLPSNPTEALKSLLCLSTHQILWDAFREVLSKAVELYTHPTVLEQHDAQQNKRSLTFIFDLDNSAVEIGRTLVSDIRRLTASLQQDYPKQRVLVTYPPLTSDFGLQLPSEIILIYDKERQGLQTHAFSFTNKSNYLTSYLTSSGIF